MSTQIQTQNSFSQLVRSENVQQRFTEILKDRAGAFTANLAVIVNNSDMLKKCEPLSIVSSAIIAASLDLPIDPNLGFSAIVPYYEKSTNTTKAQFQIMYKGFVQLAIRSGQYKTINTCEVYEGEISQVNKLTGEIQFTGQKVSDKIIGYVAYFSLTNGFEKSLYMTVQEVETHAKRYSQMYKKGFGVWKDDFDSMAKKTVLKLLLSKYGILSIEMQKAVTFDQATIENEQPRYIDNEKQLTSESKFTEITETETEPETDSKTLNLK